VGRLENSGGGGLGNPDRRDPAAVVRDRALG
jgi:N-methylhydantoinase B/oxoprolinase/acetone carboxylase alpha subunit